MNTRLSDYVNVRSRARELGLRVPTELAVLPDNFDTASTKEDFQVQSSGATIRSLWKRAGLRETPLEREGERITQYTQHGADWICSTVFVGLKLLDPNSGTLELAIAAIRDYLVPRLGSWRHASTVKADFVVETGPEGTCKKLSYEGPPDALGQLADVIREVSKHGP